MESRCGREHVQQLFLEAARLPDAERDQWLGDQCKNEEELLSEVQELLRYHDMSFDPLEFSPPHPAGEFYPDLNRQMGLPTVPGYRIVREIGTGGQAIVFEALQESTTQRVALKILRWGTMASVEERERLRREVVILARLSHPGVASIIDSGETTDGVLFIATQFVDGHRLDELLDLSASEAGLFGSNSQDEYRVRILRLFLKVCDAVDAAHRIGVVHRDLKPANILIDKRGEPRVVDFGLAKSGFQENAGATDPKGITQSGQFMGSLPWASPEQAAGDMADERSDVYSLGVILYQLASGGRFPYDVSGSMPDVITRIMRAPPKSLVQAGRQTRRISSATWPKVLPVDAQLNAMVMKALSKSPDERYQTAGEFAEAVRKYLGITGDGRARGASLKRWRTKNLFNAGAVGPILAVCLLAAVPPLLRVTGRSAKEPSVPLPTDSIKLAWESFGPAFSELTDDDAITETGDGWNIRQRSVLLPDVMSDVIWRTLMRRNSGGPVTLRLQSRGDEIVSVTLARHIEKGIDIVELAMSGKRVIHSRTEQPPSSHDAVELAVAVLSDRVTVVHDGRLVLQLHCQLTNGAWTPVLDARAADIDLFAVDFATPTTVPPGFTADVVPIELAALEFIVGHGGAAVSRPVSSSSANAKFQLSDLTTDGSHDVIPVGAIPQIAHCSMLDRIELQHVTDPIEAVEHIAKLKRLKKLVIAYSHLPTHSFHLFSQLKQLEMIDFFRTQIPSPDFSPLRRLESLKILWIPSVAVTDADLEQLAEIKSLRRISALGHRVTSQGVRRIAELPEFEWLELPFARVSGDGLRHLSTLERMWRLDISGSDVCDDDIPYLARMSLLDRLTVKNTRLTTEGVESLRNKLPKCTIVFGENQ